MLGVLRADFMCGNHKVGAGHGVFVGHEEAKGVATDKAVFLGKVSALLRCAEKDFGDLA